MAASESNSATKLLSSEDNPYLQWHRNVQDRFRSSSNEEIKEERRKLALPAGLLLQHIQGDFNVGCCMRSANGFGIFDVYWLGKRHIDSRSAVGVKHYGNFVHLKTIEDVKPLREKYKKFVALENNIPGRTTNLLHEYVWEPNSLIITGEENLGIVPELLDLCDDIVSIDMSKASVRSFNLSVACSIALYDYSLKIK